MSKPTPTQEENDRAALGEHVIEKEPDGSEPTEEAMPYEARTQTRHLEPKPPAPAVGYQTRALPPRAPPRPPTPVSETE